MTSTEDLRNTFEEFQVVLFRNYKEFDQSRWVPAVVSIYFEVTGEQLDAEKIKNIKGPGDVFTPIVIMQSTQKGEPDIDDAIEYVKLHKPLDGPRPSVALERALELSQTLALPVRVLMDEFPDEIKLSPTDLPKDLPEKYSGLRVVPAPSESFSTTIFTVPEADRPRFSLTRLLGLEKGPHRS